MMRNSSGLPDFLELLRLGGHGLDKPARPEDLFDACTRNGHLNFAPGSRFLYSNTNFLLLGLIVETPREEEAGRRAGRAHLQAARHERRPCWPHEIDTVIPNLATGYLGDAASRASAAPPTPIRRAAKAASPRRSRTC